MTPTELVQFARQKYNAEGDSFFSDSEMYNLIYTAHLEFARTTLCIERVYTTDSVVGQQEYSYPTNTIMIKRVTYDGVKLEPVTFRQDDWITGFNSDTTASGTPKFYSMWNSTLYLRAIPDTADLEIKIFSYNQPQPILQTSTLEIPELFHMDTINYMLAEMYAKDKDFNASTYYRNIWANSLQEGKKWVRKNKRGDAFVGVQDTETLDWTIGSI